VVIFFEQDWTAKSLSPLTIFCDSGLLKSLKAGLDKVERGRTRPFDASPLASLKKGGKI
jgi:hypothetical protein